MKENTKKRVPQKKRQRTKIAIATFMILGAGSVLGRLMVLQGKANQGQYEHHSQLDPEVLAAQREANIGRAQELRTIWRGWALSHQVELRAMLHAQNTERDKQTRVWELLPSTGEAGAIKPVPIIGAALNSGSGAPWTWNPGVKSLGDVEWKDEESQKRAAKDISFYNIHKLPQDFEQKHDIEVSRASGFGPSSICLWASGRITDERASLNPHPGSGKPSFVQESEELAPPYEFLQ